MLVRRATMASCIVVVPWEETTDGTEEEAKQTKNETTDDMAWDGTFMGKRATSTAKTILTRQHTERI